MVQNANLNLLEELDDIRLEISRLQRSVEELWFILTRRDSPFRNPDPYKQILKSNEEQLHLIHVIEEMCMDNYFILKRDLAFIWELVQQLDLKPYSGTRLNPGKFHQILSQCKLPQKVFPSLNTLYNESFSGMESGNYHWANDLSVEPDERLLVMAKVFHEKFTLGKVWGK